ncbi:putative glycosyl hydrolase [Mycobacterium saskatchewanense]|uniref:Glycosyl hydrolase n=1 Tax=Mycobacterium saskatchewanense TaxID=220927 RepID=A0AAJ3NRB2_9MYCO|nr:glycoside hydrolase family 65 protein [Mycobacterium saskatchewanense]ORW72001.1 glycosyl hydrolase [Mycobacterium saskatchewanense]BBX65483.1 putative glycosyl hydrolase [Mycobacterium saskatchewanense]
MIDDESFPVEPWHFRETALDLNLLAQTESLFALSNGHIGLRGNLDEGEPYGLPGTYLNSFYEIRPLPYAEAGYGYPEAGQTIVDVTNGKILRLLVEDEPFDVRYGQLLSHERVLDMRAGTLTREALWCSPAGKQVRVVSTRLVSLTQRGVAAIEYVVEAVNDFVRVTVQSELVTNEDQPHTSGDPRVAAILDNPLEAVDHENTETGALLMHRTRSSALMMAAAMDHEIDVPGRVEFSTDARDDLARTTVICGLRAGQKLRIVKYLAYGWSSMRSRPALRDQAAAAIHSARYSGWQGLLDAQRTYLDSFWDSADVEVDGDPESQQAVRFGLFHLLQASARAERRAIPAKGLTGTGYDGHAFWDTEGYVLPVLSYTAPHTVADALRWRASTLDLAKERAGELGLAGAAFPWRTIRGQECSAYWPAGTAAWHINADIVVAFERYRIVTGDDSLERDCLTVLVETARLWLSLGHHDRHGVWHLDGVTGPDEYTAIVRDNVFTNLMAAQNLRVAADACVRHHEEAEALGVTTEELAAWRDAADAANIPYDEGLGVHQQCEGFTTLAEWDFKENHAYPLLLHDPYVRLYPAQVIKQADLVLAMHWQGHAFTPEQKARNVDYYERRMVRDSSLSACTQAVLCAEVGHLELAHDYAYEAGLIDLRDLHHNTRDGLHMASLAGAWTALVGGFGGLRDDEGILSLDPQLPDGISRLRFRLRWRDFRLTVDVDHTQVIYTVRDGPGGELTIRHAGADLTLSTDSPTTVELHPRKALLPPPEQPVGREPLHRRALARRQ